MPLDNPISLPPCPDSPNCVSSLSQEIRHQVEPINFSGLGEVAFNRIRKIIKNLPGSRITKDDGIVIHAEFMTRAFKFVDDVHVVIDDTKKQIHIHSVSRVGYWDLGANRRRVEKIRMLFYSSVSLANG